MKQRDDEVAVALAESYANHFHLNRDKQPPHHITITLKYQHEVGPCSIIAAVSP